MRIVKPGRSHETTSDAEQWNQIDVLHDIVDEYEACNCDLSTFAYELGAIIMALDLVSDPAWLAALGREWVKLRVLQAEQRQATTLETSAAGRAIADKIRQLIAAWDNSAAQTAANL